MDTTGKWFNYLHKERCLSREVILEAQLGEELGRLRIPIFDEAGNELFCKLRRPADSDVGPKYLYQTGAKAALYGVNFRDMGGPNYFLEGEMDALAMRTLGYNGYSSTGGAMTFREEWLGMVAPDRENIILFDNDETGIKGALKVAKLLKTGWFSWVPPLYGKDLSDLLVAVGVEHAREILKNKVVRFDLRLENNKSAMATEKALRDEAKTLDNSVGKKFLLDLAFDIHMEYKPAVKRKTHPNVDNGIAHAKAYPIENLMKFRHKKAKCLWHNEKTPSLHLYPDNHVYCHGGCAKQFDSLAVYMKLNPGVTFLEAVNALNNLK